MARSAIEILDLGIDPYNVIIFVKKSLYPLNKMRLIRENNDVIRNNGKFLYFRILCDKK